MSTRHFITGLEFSKAELDAIIQSAIEYKQGKNVPDLSDSILTLIFANPSLRTRLSFESGMKKMNGDVNIMTATDSWEFEYNDGVIMNQGTQEHIKEAAQVLASYSNVLGLRKSDLITRKDTRAGMHSWEELREDMPIKQLAKYAGKPVINMESNLYHPCQAMADIQTLVEHFGGINQLKNKKCVLTWAPHPKPLPLATPHSQMLLPSIFGMDVTVAHPHGFSLDNEVCDLAKVEAEKSGGSFTIENNQKAAFENADVILAKSWASLEYFGFWEKEQKYRSQFTDWTVTADKMQTTNNAAFLHCLPVRRNVIVEDAVIDSPQSLVIQEAENRMWAQMAIVNALLQPSS